MHTSLVLFALAVSAPDAPLSWMNDYQAARRACANKHKPMAVFLGSGKAGYDRVVQGGLNADTRRRLAEDYIPVYIDTATEDGRSLAQQFELPGGQGVVISDRTGSLQAFRHAGELTGAELDSRLQRYADGSRVVSTTDTLTTARTSFYPPSTSSIGQGFYPAIQGYPAFGGWGGGWGGGFRGGCPNCR